MKSIYSSLALFAILLTTTFTFSQDFCANLNTIHNDIGFEESFVNCRGEQTSQTTSDYGEETMVIIEYIASQHLIPGNTGTIIFQDYPGSLDFWTYQVTTSVVYDLDAQLESAEYWFTTIQSCLESDSEWKFEITERTYSSEEKVKIWKASRPMGTL
ncbi:MAG: hypothetical protein DCO96_00940 [Fluviicola sp. XM-24bin1]|nr:MAG: hypothetical protein DCO96_00940 [Fluviicola sp. XM-24bin1]